MDWTSFRSQFPALEDRAYLNTAGGGVMSYRVARAGQQYYQEALEKGDTAWDEWLERSELARHDVPYLSALPPIKSPFCRMLLWD